MADKDADLQARFEACIARWVGRRVRIVGAHPWAGCVGIVDRFEVTVFDQPGFVVKLDSDVAVPDGQECFVFNEANWIDLDDGPRVTLIAEAGWQTGHGKAGKP